MKWILSLALLIAITSSAFAQVHPDMEKAVRGIMRQQEGGPDVKMKDGDIIQDCDLEDLGGNVLNTAKLRKDKVLIVRLVVVKDDMWEIETELLNKVTDMYKEKICVLDIIVPPMTLDQAIQQYENANTTYTVVVDKKNTFATNLGLDPKHVPSCFVFDEEGKLVDKNRTVPFTLPQTLARYFGMPIPPLTGKGF